MLPRVLTDFNAFVDGTGYAGKAKEIALPDIEKKTYEVFNGGMSSPVEVPFGYEKIMATLTFEGIVPEVTKLVTKNQAGGITLRLIGKYFDPNSEGDLANCEIVLTGMIKKKEGGSLKKGDNSAPKYEFTCSYYKETLGEEVLIEVNAQESFIEE